MRFDPSIDITALPDVYNPSDDSFLLLETMEVAPGQEFLEMGCGTGIVSLHAAKAGANVTAVDVSPAAVDCVRTCKGNFVWRALYCVWRKGDSLLNRQKNHNRIRAD